MGQDYVLVGGLLRLRTLENALNLCKQIVDILNFIDCLNLGLWLVFSFLLSFLLEYLTPTDRQCFFTATRAVLVGSDLDNRIRLVLQLDVLYRGYLLLWEHREIGRATLDPFVSV
mmetsp:Transcript_32515/g.38254  ORF Transcript_32515/g.38254 Transcript_32515/m.38254 type:complete len:115 (-) Transcript_32515:185-529(-)